jgi:aryl-alcohol dehydrogenase-like predicted oxidoreductase
MSYGEPDRGPHPWTLGEEESRKHLRHALDLGINFFDTANVYSHGSSEEIVGRGLRELARRDEIVLATKVFSPLREGPNQGGLSRKAIFAAIDASLARLGMDYVDLYQIHRFDPHTPLEETLEALHDLVRAGKVRYLGASSMYAWQFAKALFIAERHGWTRFVSMQDHFNLLNREEAREMLPLCVDQGVGVIPWSPLARGRLTRDGAESTARAKTDAFGRSLYDATLEADRKVIDAVAQIATQRGVPRAQVALAWVSAQPGITAPIVGATKLAHIDDAVASLSITLSAEELGALDAPYVPHAVAGFQ